MNLQELRSQGYTVQISHYRRFYPSQYNTEKQESYKLIKKYRAYDAGLSYHDLAPTGGLTTVKVITPSGEVHTGFAVCSVKDNFNRRKGYQIALGRALNGSEHGKELVFDYGDYSAEIKL